MSSVSKKLVVLAVVLAAAAPALAAGISGSWAVNGAVHGNPVVFSCTLKQAGGALTGTAKVQETEKPVTGTVEDKAVTFKFEVDHNGAPLEMVFTGTLDKDTEMSGSIAVSGASGEFTAKKQSPVDGP
jgi:hypothetical protein